MTNKTELLARIRSGRAQFQSALAPFSDIQHKPLAEVRLEEQAAYEQLSLLVENALDDDLFDPQRFALTEGRPFVEWIENNTFGHYEEHQADFETLE